MFPGCRVLRVFPALMHGGRTKGLLENFGRLVYKCVFTQCALFPQHLRGWVLHRLRTHGALGLNRL